MWDAARRGFTALTIFGLLLNVQQAPSSILDMVRNQWLTTPRNDNEQRMTVTVMGISCTATEWLDVTVSWGGEKYLLEYSKDYDIDIDHVPDACLEVEVPAIKTRFQLRFANSSDPNKLILQGQVPADCNDCKPKRAHTISGTLFRRGADRFELSFSGDLSDTLILETMK